MQIAAFVSGVPLFNLFVRYFFHDFLNFFFSLENKKLDWYFMQ